MNLVLPTLIILFSLAHGITPPVVDLGYVAYSGNATSPTGVQNGPVVFYGNIAYAQPPVGDLRWRAPQRLDETAVKEPKVLDARSWGPACLQSPAALGVGSEDCLTLNIWTPSNISENASLPVAFYIHAPKAYPLYDWVAQNPHVIGVSIAYRLALLGFLGGAAVENDGDLNVGLLDQRAALEWVQRHIHRFGAILGGAGGASVVMQVTAYGGTRPVPFQRAVAQSIGYGPTRSQLEVEEGFLNVTKLVGCPPSGNETMPCLRNASLGNYTPVDFIGGHCSGDGNTFVGGSPDEFVTDDDIKRIVFGRWPATTKETIDAGLALYPSPDAPGSSFATQYDRASAIAGDIVFTCLDWHVLETMRQRGRTRVYFYEWNAPDAVLYQASPYLGAMHTSDLYFLFDGKFISHRPSLIEKLLSQEAIGYWTSMTATGDPSSDKLAEAPLWESYTEDVGPVAGRPVLFVDPMLRRTHSASAMGQFTEESVKRCRYWMSEQVTAETRV
ncbi:alpha/beta-hydrolase [Hymenopellis radicata]|nr:alpha/beta-hydrolase [Hymenopellis radicata]